MYRNIFAEQARNRLTDQKMADYLAMSRMTYHKKKHSGYFSVSEAKAMCKLFGVTFEYLFADDGN